MLFDGVLKRFGPAACVFLAIIICVKVFADEPTQHQIVREIFFHETNKTPYVQLFFGVLLLSIVFDGMLLRRYLSGDSAEVKRLGKEVTRLQEKLLEPDSADPTPNEVGQ